MRPRGRGLADGAVEQVLDEIDELIEEGVLGRGGRPQPDSGKHLLQIGHHGIGLLHDHETHLGVELGVLLADGHEVVCHPVAHQILYGLGARALLLALEQAQTLYQILDKRNITVALYHHDGCLHSLLWGNGGYFSGWPWLGKRGWRW